MIIPQLLGKEDLTHIYNYKTIQYQYSFKKPETIANVKEFVKYFSSRAKMGFDKSNKEADIFMAYYYDDIGRWIDCDGCKIGKIPDIIDPSEEYSDFTGKPLSGIQNFNLYIMEIPKKGGNIKEEYKNDCLYYALLNAVQNNKNLLPKEIKSQKLLKSYLGLERGEKINVDLIKQIDELFNGYSIYVCGDAEYISPKNANLKIHILFKNSHYSLIANEGRNKSLMISCKDKSSDNLYTYYYNGAKTILIYNEEKGEQQIGWDEFYKMKDQKPSIYTFIRLNTSDNKLTLKSLYDKSKLQREELLKATEGKIDLYRYKNLNDLIKDQFRMRSEVLIEPEDIDNLEGVWLSNAFLGGLMWCENGYEGELHEIDINSNYPWAMINQYFTFPVKKGHFIKLTQDEFSKLTYFKYGVYRCIISNDDEKLNKFFRFSGKDYYTHHDLTRAKELKFKIEIIEDGNVNILQYNKEDLIYGNKVFSKYINYFYDLKKKNSTPKSKIVKLILNKLWGILCQKYMNIKTTTNGCGLDASKYKIISIRPSVKTGCQENKYTDNIQVYKTNYGRLGCFLTAFCRLRLSRLAFDNMDTIKKIHTDAIFTTKKIDCVNTGRTHNITINDELGNFKYVYLKNVKIIHINTKLENK